MNANNKPVKDAEFKPLEGKDLRVFPEEKDLPKDALNSKIDETFVARAKLTLPNARDFPAWKEELIKQLRQKSFRALPAKVPDLGGTFTVTMDVTPSLL